LVADIKAVQQLLKLMESKTLLQKIKYALDVLVDDSIARLEKNLQNQDEAAVKERAEIASFLIKISPIALRIVKVLDEEPVEDNYELTPENIELLQNYINEYGTKRKGISQSSQYQSPEELTAQLT
jgi:hypothetical protein